MMVRSVVFYLVTESQYYMKNSKTRVVCNQPVLREVATELGLHVEIVKAIVSSQSYFTKQVMESNTFDSVRWPYFGVFKSKPKEVQILSHLRGLTPDQQRIFKQLVRSGRYKLPEDVT